MNYTKLMRQIYCKPKPKRKPIRLPHAYFGISSVSTTDHYICLDCGKELDPGTFIGYENTISQSKELINEFIKNDLKLAIG